MTSPDERLQQIEQDVIVRELPDGQRELTYGGYTSMASAREMALVEAWLEISEQLRDARAEIERWRERLNEHVDCEHRNAAELRRLHAELAAERAKVQRGLALADEVENRMMATAKPAEIRAALTGEESE